MDRVMQDYWKSNLDAGGSFFEQSTAYGILTRSLDTYASQPDYDVELDSRFYNERGSERT